MGKRERRLLSRIGSNRVRALYIVEGKGGEPAYDTP